MVVHLLDTLFVKFTEEKCSFFAESETESGKTSSDTMEEKYGMVFAGTDAIHVTHLTVSKCTFLAPPRSARTRPTRMLEVL